MISADRLCDEHEVRRALARACADAGGDHAFAELQRLHPDVLALMKAGDLQVPPRILDALGFMRVMRYVRLAGECPSACTASGKDTI